LDTHYGNPLQYNGILKLDPETLNKLPRGK